MTTTPMTTPIQLTKAQVEAFLLHLQQNLSRLPSTLDHYRQQLSALLHRQVALESDALAQFIGIRPDGRAYQPSTRNHRLVIIRAFCRYLLSQGLLSTDPTQEIKRGKVPTIERYAPREEHLAAMLKALHQEPASWVRTRDEALLKLYFYTGLRLNEAHLLNLDQVDTERRELHHVRHKGGHIKDVDLHRLAAEALYRWLIERPASASEALFINQYGDRLSLRGIQKRVTKLGERAGFGQRLHPHALRRAHATELQRAGTPLGVIQQALNHQSIVTTQRYVQTDRPQIRAAIARLPTLGKHTKRSP